MKFPRQRQFASWLRLGPGGIVYVVVTGLILGAAIYTQANLLFWAFGLMVGGLVISLILAWQSLRAIGVQRLLPSHGVSGEALVLRYHITNRSWLPVFGLMIQEAWGSGGRGWKRIGPVADAPPRLKARPHGWALHLGPHQAIQADATCWPLRRGLLRFQTVLVSTSFPFGIIRKVVAFELPAELLIYPRLYRMNRRILYSLSNLDPSGRKQVERGGGTEEFFGIRPYRYGDSLKMIDWKHTARTGNLVAREMTQPSPPRVMLLLDLTAGGDRAAGRGQHAAGEHPNAGGRHTQRASLPDRKTSASATGNEERAVSLAASLICDAYFHGYQIGLAVAGVRCTTFPVHHSLPHRTKMLEALASLDLSDRTDRNDRATDRPSVIVWAGGGDAAPPGDARGRAAILGAADLDRYVDPRSLATETLARRSRPTSRRAELAEEAANAAAESEAAETTAPGR
jgi:uncharacterized protein (DUF58 family)